VDASLVPKTLQGDLGAESIDFLDIVFRLERNFGIKIPRGELFPENEHLQRWLRLARRFTWRTRWA